MVTCTLSVVVMHKHPSREEVTALVVLTAGVMLAVWQGTVSGKPYAIAFCVAGTICNGAMVRPRPRLAGAAAGAAWAAGRVF